MTLQDSLAIRLPAEVGSDEDCNGAVDLCLEFWRGVEFLGTYKLPLAKIRQALAGQVQDTLQLKYSCVQVEAC